MKNAKTYVRKIRKLLGQLRKVSPSPVPPGLERVRGMLRGILQADTTRKAAERALDAIGEEYVDLNELRVSPIKDITDCMGRDLPGAREKAETICAVLNNVFTRANDISIDFLESLPRRELRRHLSELGLGPYAAAYTALTVFGLPTIPVDHTLAACLEIDACVAPGSSVAEVRALLERIVAPKDIPAAHEALRTYAEKQGKAYAKKIRPAPVVLPAPQAPRFPLTPLAPPPYQPTGKTLPHTDAGKSQAPTAKGKTVPRPAKPQRKPSNRKPPGRE